MLPHRIRDLSLGADHRAREPAEGARQPSQGEGVLGRAAAVHGDVQHRLPGQALDAGRDCHLHRVAALEITLDRPAVLDAGGEHRGVLAGAVHGQRRRDAA